MSTPIRATVDLSKPHWLCKCGAVAMPLTDDTTCQCEDIYKQEWEAVTPQIVCDPTGPHLAKGQSLEDFCDAYQRANW